MVEATKKDELRWLLGFFSTSLASMWSQVPDEMPEVWVSLGEVDTAVERPMKLLALILADHLNGCDRYVGADPTIFSLDVLDELRVLLSTFVLESPHEILYSKSSAPDELLMIWTTVGRLCRIALGAGERECPAAQDLTFAHFLSKYGVPLKPWRKKEVFEGQVDGERLKGGPELPRRISARVNRSDGTVARFYRDAGSARRDHRLVDGSWQRRITRQDLGLSYFIEEGRRTYYRFDWAPEGDSLLLENVHYLGSRWKKLREEELEGEPCSVFLVEISDAPDRKAKTTSSREIAFVSQRTLWLRRTVELDENSNPGLTTDWQDVSLEPIPPETFEPPVGFDEISIVTGKVVT